MQIPLCDTDPHNLLSNQCIDNLCWKKVESSRKGIHMKGQKSCSTYTTNKQAIIYKLGNST